MRVWSLLVASFVVAGCGVSPSVQAKPAAAQAAEQIGPTTSEASGMGRKVFVFFAYDTLSADERRVLEASAIAVGQGPAQSGSALYDALGQSAPKALANYLNQTAVLASTRFANGRTAISYLERIDELTINHLRAAVDPALKAEVERVSAPKARKGVAYVGPEDSSLMHGKYDTSFRENRAYTSQQFCFSATDGFAKADIDLDEECPLAGDKVALAKHIARVIKHELLRKWPGEQYDENSEPDFLYHLMTTPAIDGQGRSTKVGRGLQPNYRVERLIKP